MSTNTPLSVLLGLLVCLILVVAPACSECDKATGEESAPAVETPPVEAKPTSFDLENLPDSPKVVMKTTEGDITLELDNLKAPITTKNFLQYVQDGHYNGTIFHRVMPGFMIQGGGYTKALYENARTQAKTTRDPIKNEASNGLSNARGTIAMARRGDPHSATTQFFINVVDNGKLDYNSRSAGYTVFGKVVAGMEAVEAIRNAPTKAWGSHANMPEKLVEIISVEPLID